MRKKRGVENKLIILLFIVLFLSLFIIFENISAAVPESDKPISCNLAPFNMPVTYPGFESGKLCFQVSKTTLKENCPKYNCYSIWKDNEIWVNGGITFCVYTQAYTKKSCNIDTAKVCNENAECVAKCTVNGNCDDNNLCTADSCVNGICSNANKAYGTSCSGTLLSVSPFAYFLKLFGVTAPVANKKVCDGKGNCIDVECVTSDDCPDKSPKYECSGGWILPGSDKFEPEKIIYTTYNKICNLGKCEYSGGSAKVVKECNDYMRKDRVMCSVFSTSSIQDYTYVHGKCFLNKYTDSKGITITTGGYCQDQEYPRNKQVRCEQLCDSGEGRTGLCECPGSDPKNPDIPDEGSSYRQCMECDFVPFQTKSNWKILEGKSCIFREQGKDLPGVCGKDGLCYKGDPCKIGGASKNGLACKISSPNDGFCKDGTCVPKSCLNLGMGVKCGASDSSGLKCCQKDEECCNLGGDKEAVCCKKNLDSKQVSNEICKTDKNVPNFCNPTPGFCNAKGLEACPGLDSAGLGVTWSTCCPKGECVIKTNSYIGFGTYTVAYCGKSECDSSKGETSCGSGLDGGKYCCKRGEHCESSFKGTGFPKCIVDSCDEKSQKCDGTGAKYSSPGYSICCKLGVESCGTFPSGYARCVSLGTPQGNPISTKSTSVYMIRDKNVFSLNGIGYIIKPSLQFNKPIVIKMPSYDNNYETYKFSSHEAILELCNYSLINNLTSEISILGANISFIDGLNIAIPVNAINYSVNITIEKYNFSNCYAIGSDNNFDFSILSNPITPPIPVKKNLVAYYPFEGNANDASGNKINGVNHGAIFGNGKIGKAASFIGKNWHFDFGKNALLDLNNFTISLWIKPNSWNNNVFPGLISRRDSFSKMSWELFYYSSNKDIEFWFGNSGTGKFKTKINPLVRKWSFITLSKQGNVFKSYLNGALVNTQTVKGNIPAGNNLKIGVLGADALTYGFNGMIDEVKIWNYALNNTEITKEYNRIK